MNNYIKQSNQLKEFFIDFALKLSKNFTKPNKKFICEMLFGIASAKSIHITKIARTLKENISVKETSNRLYERLNDFDYDNLWKNYHNSLKSTINENTLFHIDNSDIIKPNGTHFEDLGTVIDGSSKEKKIEKGYTVTEIVAVNEKSNTPTSVYSHIFSNISKDYKSDNTETKKALDNVYNSYGAKGTVVGDRGYDDKKWFEYFQDKKWDFIVRGKNNRTLKYKGKKYRIKDFANKYKGKITIKVYLKNKIVNRKASYFKVRLNGMKKDLYVVLVYFKDEVAIFYTNKELTCKNDVIRVVADYYKRWRIEEYFKFKKQEYGFEKYRVRSLQSMNALNSLLSMTLSAMAPLCEKQTKLSLTILKCAESIKEKVYFKFYRISSGIYELLKKLSTGVSKYLRSKEKEKQLQFFSLFDDFEKNAGT